MIIHVVSRGESLYSIARRYNTSVDKLKYDNQIENSNLVIGQALVIDFNQSSHRVTRGESLYSIAQNFGTTVNEILAANPDITNSALIYPGQIIIIPRGSRRIDVNGYTVNFSSSAYNDTMPFLTYISPFSYEVTAEGELGQLNADSVIAKARSENVAPLMCITNTEKGGSFSSGIAHSVLTNSDAQDNLIDNILNELEKYNYYGLNIDFEYVYPFDRESYNQFLRKISQILHSRGYILITAVAPKTSANQPGTLYEAHDYAVHGEVCDLVIIMTYEWGYTYGPAMAVAPVNSVRRVLEYAVTEIPSRKILMGMPNYGYNWTLPFVQGTAARTISNVRAVSLAAQVGAEIKYDQVQQAPFFNYYDSNGVQHEVWFDDARSVQARLQLVSDLNLAGISYWTIDTLFRQGLIVLQNMYIINKVL